jgi:hypothetical protein
VVSDAGKDMPNAISGSLLMEQFLVPNVEFYRREDGNPHDPLAAACQAMDKHVLAPGTALEAATQLVLTETIERCLLDLSDEETESAHQHLAAHM